MDRFVSATSAAGASSTIAEVAAMPATHMTETPAVDSIRANAQRTDPALCRQAGEYAQICWFRVGKVWLGAFAGLRISGWERFGVSIGVVAKR